MGYAFMPFARYFDFSGRSTRREYWAFALLITVIYAVFAALEQAHGSRSDPSGFLMLGFIKLILLGGAIVPSFSVTVRRLHDQDRSAWFLLLAFVPILGSLICFVLMLMRGTDGENRFGEDPR